MPGMPPPMPGKPPMPGMPPPWVICCMKPRIFWKSADFQKMRGFMQQMTQGGGMPGMGGFPGMGGGMPGMGGFPGMGGGMPGMGMPGMGGGRPGRGGGAPRRQRPVKKRKGFGEL